MRQEPEVTFDQLFKLQLGYLALAGPPELIVDERIIAGLLFPKWNDLTRRVLRYETRFSTVHLVTSKTYRYQILPVASKSVERLHEGGLLDGTLAEREQLRLSPAGMHKVVLEWFATSAPIMDRLKLTLPIHQ